MPLAFAMMRVLGERALHRLPLMQPNSELKTNVMQTFFLHPKDYAPCVVTDAADAAAVERVVAFWEALGSRVLRRSPASHDDEVAWVSHVPHVVAWAFAEAFAGAPAAAREVAGGGFRDFTRIARSSPELWGDILTANRKSISAPLEAVGETLADLARAIESNDVERVRDLIASARGTLAAEAPSDRKH